jgi:triosephosphate isomerase
VYGGSVKSESSGKLLALSNVDGVLVGGGSLKPEEFVKIIDSAPKF